MWLKVYSVQHDVKDSEVSKKDKVLLYQSPQVTVDWRYYAVHRAMYSVTCVQDSQWSQCGYAGYLLTFCRSFEASFTFHIHKRIKYQTKRIWGNEKVKMIMSLISHSNVIMIQNVLWRARTITIIDERLSTVLLTISRPILHTRLFSTPPCFALSRRTYSSCRVWHYQIVYTKLGQEKKKK